MPVEIRELHIRIHVNESQPAIDAAAAPTNNGREQQKEDALVAECIEQTLRIIEQQKER